MDAVKREQIILNNQNLVYKVARMLTGRSIVDEDTFQTGTIGLIKAVDAFDDSKGYKFSVLAVQCIRNEIMMSWRKENKAPPKNLVCSLHSIIMDDLEVENAIIGDADVNYPHNTEFIGRLLPKEQEVLRLTLLGYKQNEIADELRISQSHVSKIRKRVRLKYNKFYHEKGER